VLGGAKYDKIPAVRAAAARALAEMAAIPAPEGEPGDEEEAAAEQQTARRAARKPRPGELAGAGTPRAAAAGHAAPGGGGDARRGARTPRTPRTPASPATKAGQLGMSPGSRRWARRWPAC
jgi:hypothetical protein